jgi:hypothetical protein
MLRKNHSRTFGCLQKEVRFERSPGQDTTSKRRLRTHAAVEEPPAGLHSLTKLD